MSEAGFGVSVLAGFLSIVLGLPLVMTFVVALIWVVGRPNMPGVIVGAVLATALIIAVGITVAERYVR